MFLPIICVSRAARHVSDTARHVPDAARHMPDAARHVPDVARQLSDTARQLPKAVRHVSGDIRHVPKAGRQLPDRNRHKTKHDFCVVCIFMIVMFCNFSFPAGTAFQAHLSISPKYPLMSKPAKMSYWAILKQTASDFVDDNVTKLSASLAYYTLFSIGPLILIVISVAGLFFEQNRISGSLYNQIRTLMGENAAQQVLQISENMRIQNQGMFYVVVGFITLFLGATSVFADMQDSINIIWSIKAKPKQSWLKYITSRLLSFSLIVGLGFLLMVSLLVNTFMDLLFKRLLSFLGEGQAFLAAAINYGITFCIITLLFTVIYKVLPDAKVRWKDTIVGAAVTGVLFMIGKFGIGYYLGSSSIGTQYGAAASIIIFLLWVNYSSLILYFGAEFTKVWALNRGNGITPNEAAVFIRKTEGTESPFHPQDKAANPNLRGAVIPIVRVDGSEPDAEVAKAEKEALKSQKEEQKSRE